MKIYRNKYCPSCNKYFVEMTGNNRFSYGIIVENSSGRYKLRYRRVYKPDLKDKEYFSIVGKLNLIQCVLDSVKEQEK